MGKTSSVQDFLEFAASVKAACDVLDRVTPAEQLLKERQAALERADAQLAAMRDAVAAEEAACEQECADRSARTKALCATLLSEAGVAARAKEAAARTAASVAEEKLDYLEKQCAVAQFDCASLSKEVDELAIQKASLLSDLAVLKAKFGA